MRRFCRLLQRIEEAAHADEAAQAIRRYLADAAAVDAAWGVALLAGAGAVRVTSAAVLRRAAHRASGLPPWLFDACEAAAGELADTVAHALPAPEHPCATPLARGIEHLRSLRGEPAEAQEQALAPWLAEADADERWLIVALSGATRWRPPPLALLRRALVDGTGLAESRIASRLLAWCSGRVAPSAAALAALTDPASSAEDDGEPLPFAPPPRAPAPGGMPGPPSLAACWVRELRPARRLQLVRRRAATWIWSDDFEPMTQRLPALASLARGLADDTVLEGQWRPEAGTPADGFVATDLLVAAGEDWRARAWRERQVALRAVLPAGLPMGEAAECTDRRALTERRAHCRLRGADALLLGDPAAPYGSPTWRWDAAPLTVRSVLVHVRSERGADGERLCCGFALPTDRLPPATGAAGGTPATSAAAPTGADAQWVVIADVTLVPSDEAYLAVRDAARSLAVRRAGPVRLLRPQWVAAIEFDGVQRRERRRSGIALRGARLRGLPTDAGLDAVPTLDAFVATLAAIGAM